MDWKPLFQDSFVPLIQYHKIPANILTNEIVPLKVVPDDIIITALAYQVRSFSKILENEILFFLMRRKSAYLHPSNRIV